MNALRLLLAYAALGLAVCGVLMGPPWRRRDRPVAWLVACLGSAWFLLMAMLTASLTHLRPPLWLVLSIMVGLDAAITWVMVMLAQARRRREGRTNSHPTEGGTG